VSERDEEDGRGGRRRKRNIIRMSRGRGENMGQEER